MKHAREDYKDRFEDTLGKIPDDEPVFLIRGQDRFGPSALNYYAQLVHQNARNPGDHAFARLVERQAAIMEDYQQIKRRVKFPDAPGVNEPVLPVPADVEDE